MQSVSSYYAQVRHQTPDMWSQQDTGLAVKVCVSIRGQEQRKVQSLSSLYLSDKLITHASVLQGAFVCIISQPSQIHPDKAVGENMHAWGCRWTHTEIYRQNHRILLPCPSLDTQPTEVYTVLYCNLLLCIQCERSMPSFTSCQTAAHLNGLLQQHELPCRLCIRHQLTHKYTHPLLDCLNSF